ncbi:serine hydrolase domain-containing protein [Arsenicicoccus sp. oral taxon 190]|uniref:serine hydrolase domain-containing protein n=1 Tax=Arsenicicoccus sp. oral taxon 190 TaxID=1658671 RepID=UPI00067A28D2|nr:serine hydrolase domain-containing protein [Arsenicicoccus sp. oral taxon 190]AKT52071.1 beta-lactamase [Arsenicicoccus sp. oral taxon 190]
MTDLLPADLARQLAHLVGTAQHEWRAPGVSAGIVRDGRLVWSTHVGSARLEPARTADDDTQFLIGSVTKTFSALALMVLRDRGELTLNDRLADFLPDTPFGALSLRQMLSHSSGLQREPAGRLWETFEAPDRDALLADLAQAERVLPRHKAFHYSNLAYALIGQVLEQVTEQPWEDAVRALVLDPLGMTRTGLTPDEQGRAHGYQVHPWSRAATAEPVIDLRATAPLGGLWSTVADLGRYAAFCSDPDRFDLLSAETLDEMCSPVIMADPEDWTTGHGIGFGLFRRGERVYAGHGGAMPGFLTGLRFRRRDRVGAVVFANATAGPSPLTLATDLLCAVLDHAPTTPPVWRPSAASAERDELLGRWWSEGSPLDFEVRGDALWSTMPGSRGALDDTRYEQVDRDLYRAVEGRERGERLELVRDEDGRLVKMYFATYAVTREPLAFAELDGEG